MVEQYTHWMRRSWIGNAICWGTLLWLGQRCEYSQGYPACHATIDRLVRDSQLSLVKLSESQLEYVWVFRDGEVLVPIRSSYGCAVFREGMIFLFHDLVWIARGGSTIKISTNQN